MSWKVLPEAFYSGWPKDCIIAPTPLRTRVTNFVVNAQLFELCGHEALCEIPGRVACIPEPSHEFPKYCSSVVPTEQRDKGCNIAVRQASQQRVAAFCLLAAFAQISSVLTSLEFAVLCVKQLPFTSSRLLYLLLTEQENYGRACTLRRQFLLFCQRVLGTQRNEVRDFT